MFLQGLWLFSLGSTDGQAAPSIAAPHLSPRLSFRSLCVRQLSPHSDTVYRAVRQNRLCFGFLPSNTSPLLVARQSARLVRVAALLFSGHVPFGPTHQRVCLWMRRAKPLSNDAGRFCVCSPAYGPPGWCLQLLQHDVCFSRPSLQKKSSERVTSLPGLSVACGLSFPSSGAFVLVVENEQDGSILRAIFQSSKGGVGR